MKEITSIALDELKEMAAKTYGGLVKADVDVAKGIVLIDMELHADGEAQLLESGSKQSDLWGITLYPDKFGTDDFIEFDSMINLRPSQGNRSRDVEDEAVRAKIRRLVGGAVHV
ncbi:MAG TPA: DUF5674 family protein [Candidatus Saccharimonadales bacterium]|nr:DUF5674 family protein [Candidatus Saccharimonadales bacterium]